MPPGSGGLTLVRCRRGAQWQRRKAKNCEAQSRIRVAQIKPMAESISRCSRIAATTSTTSQAAQRGSKGCGGAGRASTGGNCSVGGSRVSVAVVPGSGKSR